MRLHTPRLATRLLFLVCGVTFFSTSYAYENSVVGDLSTFDREVTLGHMKALSFNTNHNKKLVVECIETSGVGIIGLSDMNYAGYNMISPAVKIPNGKCVEFFDHIYNGGSIVFKWTLLGCSYGQCKYDASYEIENVE